MLFYYHLWHLLDLLFMKETKIILSHHVNVNYGDPSIHFLNQFLPVQSLSGAGAVVGPVAGYTMEVISLLLH